MDLGLSALPGMIYSRSISTSLRLSDVDGGEAAGLPHALLLVFLRGNADLAGLARASERVSVAERRNSGRGCWLGVHREREGVEARPVRSAAARFGKGEEMSEGAEGENAFEDVTEEAGGTEVVHGVVERRGP